MAARSAADARLTGTLALIVSAIAQAIPSHIRGGYSLSLAAPHEPSGSLPMVLRAAGPAVAVLALAEPCCQRYRNPVQEPYIGTVLCKSPMQEPYAGTLRRHHMQEPYASATLGTSVGLVGARSGQRPPAPKAQGAETPWLRFCAWYAR